jgi:hypothetical protein
MTRATKARLQSVLLLVLLTSGCSVFKRGEPASPDAPVTVSVENRGWSQVAIYAVAGGQRQRLGEVTGASSGQFILPPLFATRSDVRLVATPLAGRQQYTTGVILASPGDTVVLTVENVLSMSSWTVR